MTEERISVTTICGGHSSVYRAIGIPLAEAFETDDTVELHDGELPTPLQGQQPPRMDGVAIAATVGVLAFLGSWAITRLLDEFYDAKIRPKLKAVLDSKTAKALSTKPNKKWLFQLGVWYNQERVLVLLTLVGDSLEQALEQEHLLPSLLSQAVDWLDRYGAQSPVHLYIVEDGKVNLKPLHFDHALEAQSYIQSLWPVVVPRRVANDKAV